MLLSAPLLAETPAEAQKRRRLEYPELTQLVEQSQSAPPEFAAHVLLRVAEFPGLRDNLWKRDLLEQAFQTATAARNPIKKRFMPAKATEGSRERMIAESANLGLDRLTLQTEAVKAMLSVNPKRARELFLSIQQPTPTRLRCEDALLDDPSSYFATATAVATIAFTAEERKRDDLVLFLNERVQRVTSAVEIAPAARMIAATSPGLSPTQSKLLVSSLAAALMRIDGDDRSFSSSPAIFTEVASLSGSGLAEAYRQFLVKNFTGPRCADGTNDEIVQTAVSDFNSRIPAGMPPLKLEDLKPAKIDVKAALDGPSLLDEPNRARVLALLFGPDQTALTPDQKNTAEWRERFTEFKRDVEGMKPATGESESNFFYRKGSDFYSLLAVAPPGELRDGILQQYIAFLKSSSFQQEGLIEWFAQVESLAAITRSMNAAEYRKMLDAFENSGHAVLSIYARIEKLLPTAPSWAQSGQ
jgi:hypothetical protein